MPLTDLTSRAAVEQAIDEFDRLGREAFLSKYGFGEAREYFVRRTNRLYDSKAIDGAAYGYEHPDRGPLKPQEFSGGETTVQAKLEELEFEVVVVRTVAGGKEARPERAAAQLEKAFHARMIEIYKDAKSIGYNASRFLSMVTEQGGLATARILLGATKVSDGYAALCERKRLDLTVEAVILEPDWRSLFSEAERNVAISRLKEYGYQGPLPPS